MRAVPRNPTIFHLHPRSMDAHHRSRKPRHRSLAPFSPPLPWYQHAVKNLTEWIKEFLDAARAAPLNDGLLSGLGFGEVSGSSPLAGVVYRMAVLQPDVFGEGYIAWADAIRSVLGGLDASGNPHITDSGIVTPAVNPHS
ncbi:hypothetical protein BDQ17DRAFT_1544310 [Cyathus striatus]|nr:hypothetical protein BDQ17DRAFT_1544310 [Cyathus striatus]